MTEPTPPTQRRTVVLTGASRGIGHATVKRFSGEGWRIITCSRDAVPEECKRDPNWSHHIPTDLSDMDSVEAFIARTNEIQIGRASCRERVVSTCRSRWSPYH